jgi:hypothetical protein
MTQTKQQQLIDYLDDCLPDGYLLVIGPQPGNAEVRQEWEAIRLALEAIRCNALAAQIRAVRFSLRSADLAN